MESTEALVEKLTGIVESVEKIAEEPQIYYDKVHECDLKLCDLMHLLENGTFKSYELVRIATQIKKVRIERRIAKENQELTNQFITCIGQLQSAGSRTMLKQNLFKKYKEMNLPYHNRIYTEEEIKWIVGGIYE